MSHSWGVAGLRQQTEVLFWFRANYEEILESRHPSFLAYELCDLWQENICNMRMDKKTGYESRFVYLVHWEFWGKNTCIQMGATFAQIFF